MRLHFMKKLLTLRSESDVEERTVGPETSLTSSSELSDISDNPVQHSVVTSISR